MSVLFTAIFSAASIVRDREFWFLREVLVAPVGRTRSSSRNALAARLFPSSRESSFCAWPAWRAFPATRF
jgi:hypothetical protein